MHQLKKVIDLLKPLEVRGDIENICFKGVHYDSRKVNEGDLFVCVNGFSQDGHKFIPQALQKGAVAVIGQTDNGQSQSISLRVEDSRKALAQLGSYIFGFPSMKMKMIGITGTNGKTTVTYLLEEILKQANYNTGIIGTIGVKIKEKTLPAKNTTPESLDLQELLASMLNEDVHFVAMEVSSHGLELKRVEECHFDVGVFTNFTQDHLDFHQTLDNYLMAKLKLFENLGKIKKDAQAVVNADDPKSEVILEKTKVPVLSYSAAGKGHVNAESITMDAGRTLFLLKTPVGTEEINLKLLGRFNVYNSLAAVSTALALGINLQAIKKGLENVAPIRGRFEIVNHGGDFLVVVDYAHTPDGVKNILQGVRQITKNRMLTILGCGGDRDRTKRPLMGEIASELSDYCFVTSDNPRTEDPERIIQDILAGIKKTNYCVQQDRETAIRMAIGEAKKGDIVVIAGKGHESYQILKDKTIHFDDAEIARKYLPTN